MPLFKAVSDSLQNTLSLLGYKLDCISDKTEAELY